MNVPATPARPSAISPIGKKSVLALRDDPPTPVSGAPWGSTNFGDVVGTNVVIGERTVVVVADPGADDPPDEDDGAVVVVPAPDVSVVVVAVDVSVVVVVGVPDDKVVVVAAGGTRHVDVVIVLSLSVTAPFIARTRPFTTAALSSVIEVNAMMLPMKLVVEPRVAELPTSQKTLHACAPFSNTTEAEDAVVSVEPA